MEQYVAVHQMRQKCVCGCKQPPRRRPFQPRAPACSRRPSHFPFRWMVPCTPITPHRTLQAPLFCLRDLSPAAARPGGEMNSQELALHPGGDGSQSLLPSMWRKIQVKPRKFPQKLSAGLSPSRPQRGSSQGAVEAGAGHRFTKVSKLAANLFSVHLFSW